MDRYRVAPGQEIDLSEWDPADRSGFAGGKHDARTHLKRLRRRLSELQRLLWADGKHKVLVVFQAMDTGGKDGTIRNVFTGVNPQGIDVYGFKKPTPEELGHDYLWRVHEHAPSAGSLAVFNRSHYEDVLVVRVLGLVPEERWQRRFGHINDFERMLSDEGTTILKFYLHISPDEQAERLRARLDDDTKNWKFNKDDLDARKLWPSYMEAYEAMSEPYQHRGCPLVHRPCQSQVVSQYRRRGDNRHHARGLGDAVAGGRGGSRRSGHPGRRMTETNMPSVPVRLGASRMPLPQGFPGRASGAAAG